MARQRRHWIHIAAIAIDFRETDLMQPRTNKLRQAILAVLMGAAVGLAPAVAAQQRSFDIPASDASAALPEYARQAGVQIIAPGAQLRGLRTPAVKGTMDARVALRLLLADTGLHVAAANENTITLNAQVPRSNWIASIGAAAQQSNSPAPVADQQQAPSDDGEQADDDVRDLAGVTVTGSFIRRIDTETALPVTTLGQEEIDLSGASTVSDLLSQLPQSAGFDNSETSTGPNAARGDAASVNLRGIGSGNTLVLLNGRRIAPHPISSGAVPRLSSNINQIPLGAIQRIEVLRDGASALYGSDAVAGVVNTILRKDYVGAEASIRYGSADDGSTDDLSVNLLGGKMFNGARTNVMGFVGYYHRDPLDASSKDFSQTGDLRERAGSDNTRWDNRSVSGPYGRYTVGTANPDGTFTPGAVDGFGPQFYTRPGDNGVEIADGSLPRSLRYDYTPEYVLLPETTRYQAFGSLNHLFDNDMEGFAQFFYYRAESTIANAASPISANSDNDIYVPSTNYYNPFGTRFYGPGTANPGQAASDVLLRNFRPVGMGSRSADVTSRAWQFLAGLRGWVGDSWQWEAAAQYGEGKTTDVAHNMISESRLRAQLALDTPDAFNVFGGAGANAQSVLDAVRIDNVRTGEATLGIVDAKATGDLFDISGGAVQAAVGVEYRRETFSDARDEFSNGNDVIALSPTSNSSGSRNVTSVFGELSVPFFSEANAITGFQRLDLSLAVRSEHYSDFGTATKPKISVAWSPVSSLLLRGSYNEGFRAPTLAQVFVGRVSRRSGGVPDPYRADVVGSPADLGDETRQVVRGGNPNLGPEEATQHSFGAVFQPSFLDGFSISADYFEIKQTDVIDTYGQEQQLELDYRLRTSGQGSNSDVVRLPVTAADQAAFALWNATHPNDQRTPAGAVDFVRDTYINIATRKVSGIDFGMAYKLPDTRFGDFSFRAAYARMNTFEQQRDEDSPAISDLEMNGLPKGRGVASVYWEGQRMDAGLRANYIGGFYDTGAPWNADGSMFRVDSLLTFNAFVGIRLGDSDKTHSYLRLGVNNLLDEDPPFADENRGFYESIHDPRGRYLYAEWRVKM